MSAYTLLSQQEPTSQIYHDADNVVDDDDASDNDDDSAGCHWDDPEKQPLSDKNRSSSSGGRTMRGKKSDLATIAEMAEPSTVSCNQIK